MTSIVIEKRFCGPPKSANGGYVCGILAGHVDGSAEVILLAPPPLDQRLDIVVGSHGVELRKEETILAAGRRARVDVPEIPIVDLAEAEEAACRRHDQSRLCGGWRAASGHDRRRDDSSRTNECAHRQATPSR